MLFIFRLGAHMPTPGIDTEAMARMFEQGGVLGFLDMFAGGALRRFSVFALGVAPYINASIVMQLLVVVIPAWKNFKGRHEGRKKIVMYTRWGTVFFALVQAVGMTIWLRNLGIFSGTLLDAIVAVVTTVTGAIAVMWLGEEVTDHGIGNGISLLIFAGIVARIPEALVQTWSLLRMGELNLISLLVAVILMVVVVADAFSSGRDSGACRAIRQTGRWETSSTAVEHLHSPSGEPGGVHPIIFASSVLLFPYTIFRFFSGTAVTMQNLFAPGSAVYMVLYVVLIVFFAYFYTAVVFNPVDVANNMKKYGGFILGIRPGRPTSEYIEKVMTRITLGGAVFLAVVALVPTLMTSVVNMNTFYFGGTAVLIVVGVALDTVHQIEAQLLMRHYEGILKRRDKTGGLLRL